MGGRVGKMGRNPGQGFLPIGIFERNRWYNPYVPSLLTPSMMDSPLWREGEMKLWTGRSDQINNRFGDDTFNYSIHEVNTPATLLRSMVWVTWQGYNFYTIGGDGIPQGPVGYAFGDLK